MSEVRGFISIELSDDGEYIYIADGGKFYAGYRRRYFDVLDGHVVDDDKRLEVALNKASGYREELLGGKRVNVHLVWTLQEDRRFYDRVMFDRVEVTEIDESDW